MRDVFVIMHPLLTACTLVSNTNFNHCLQSLFARNIVLFNEDIALAIDGLFNDTETVQELVVVEQLDNASQGLLELFHGTTQHAVINSHGVVIAKGIGIG